MTSLISIAVTAGLLGGCAGDDVTQRDGHGHHTTSSDSHGGDRTLFAAAINAGLRDHDRRHEELRARTLSLDDDARDEYLDHSEELKAQRQVVATRLQRLDSTLMNECESHRDDVLDAYEELRADLDDAQEDIGEELS